ncbi:M42 family metallopeptidase [Ktedonospora formicarum]|uniref:Hydrolase n=1 Tax=Ktedonospora formicarum TaxID=2778364 RepID=A0A8J3HZL6_9CHLR|nr:M42 family metallopeptidase [Ktedonospora formicarum]GHO43567.1 hydrolase [Ktedonospora formicarum]
MDKSRVDFLRRLVASPSPSGFERPAQQVVREEIQKYTDEIRTDVHGNVIASLNAQAEMRVMLEAHCDELGFLIRYIDEQGYLYFAPIGGFDASTLPGNRVHIHTPNGVVNGVIGRKPVHSLSADERDKAPKLWDLWIDIGASNKEEALERVQIGSVGTRAAELETLHKDIIISRALDDKSGVFAVLEAVRRIHAKREQLKAGVFFVSAVQEEIGLRGARTSAYSVNPHIAIAVDVAPTTDIPGAPKTRMGEMVLNGGPILTIGAHINLRVYERLIKAAEEAGISYQVEASAGPTSTDADAIQVARGPIATGLISIPCRYLHTGSEMVSLKDVDEVAELISRFVLALDADTNLIP